MQKAALDQLLTPINSFLYCQTPQAWLDKAREPEQLAPLLIDHCNCELKAAQTALMLIRRYVVDANNAAELLAWLKPYEDYVYRQIGDGNFDGKHNGLKKMISANGVHDFGDDLVEKMVLLIKEELHHFQQVLEIMQSRDIAYTNVSAGRYARGMMRYVRTYEPQALVDKLICGAYIEARSCERFARLAPYLDDELQKFYISLLRSEARHYQDYLTLARQVAGEDISPRVRFFGQKEAELINTPDADFKFHSGIPIEGVSTITQ
ncbi:tRNA isopentenyl-2-thiomethyl-A-37 hydroxylase MiaE [Alteromonas sp. ASW11-130]|uniref:tRNA isopentenyl-2-thiomethyl-A-37 hydroxylase MiaE n=1 Tax=Alteromonas sp. ASW11-130 TaxID=3015775 RepID=UPI00224202A0|nr:tRNA isopentenyl-2-thiomethyl-A-37 hydroxylase MiaE [Alteromonas sp. ASW11-130]MCW8092596.1 tRNA isopentenyl-2-thiomethyl-A-37 hydroxylase MiaE [Alteromonas sp. ASW11-130]